MSALNSSQTFGVLVGGGLIDRQLGGERGFLQRIGLGARFLRRDIDGDHVLAALEQRFQHRLAEGLLAVDHDTHSTLPTLHPRAGGASSIRDGPGSPASRATPASYAAFSSFSGR